MFIRLSLDNNILYRKTFRTGNDCFQNNYDLGSVLYVRIMHV